MIKYTNNISVDRTVSSAVDALFEVVAALLDALPEMGAFASTSTSCEGFSSVFGTVSPAD
jgi:hypothetical protein